MSQDESRIHGVSLPCGIEWLPLRQPRPPAAEVRRPRDSDRPVQAATIVVPLSQTVQVCLAVDCSSPTLESAPAEPRAGLQVALGASTFANSVTPREQRPKRGSPGRSQAGTW